MSPEALAANIRLAMQLAKAELSGRPTSGFEDEVRSLVARGEGRGERRGEGSCEPHAEAKAEGAAAAHAVRRVEMEDETAVTL